jgi:hypothetical protein
MGRASYLRIYRQYTSAELDAEIASLKEQLKDPYASIGSGGNNASRDIAFVAEKLDGATRAKLERIRGRAGTRTTLANFGTSNR